MEVIINWSIETKTRVIFLAVVVLVLIVGIFAYQNARSFIDTNELVTSSRINLEEQDSALIALSDAEAYQLGYLTTGDESYLESYARSMSQVFQHLDILRSRLAGSVTQTERINRLTPLILARLGLADSAILLRRAGLTDASNTLASSPAGKNLTDEIRTIFAAMTAQSTQLLGTRSERSTLGAQYTLATFIALTLFMLGLLGFSYYFIHRDLAGRRKLEHRLREERTLLRTMIDAVPDNIYVKDSELRFVLTNRAQAALMGADAPEEVIGKSDSDFSPSDFVVQYAADERRILETGVPLLNREEPVIDSRGESLIMLTTKVPVRNGNGEITQIVGISHDITARKKVEQEIQLLNENLQQQTTRLEAANKELEAFSYSISHDLRAPLRAIDGFSRILVEEYGPQLEQEVLRYLEKVRSNAQRMGELIDDLLSFSRISRQAVNKQPVEPAALVQQVLDEELREDRENRQVEINVGDLPACQADPILLRQVFVNLLGNALKFTSKCAYARIDVGSKRENGSVVYYVKDNGAGFDNRYVHKLFGVFQRLHRIEDYNGTGVGLAIVQRVILRHGGQIWAEGAVNQGATFYFTLGEVYVQ